MAIAHVAEVPVSRFEDPVSEVLSHCEQMTDGIFNFSPAAVRLKKMPNMPMASAVSRTPFECLNQLAGILTVIALAPGDDTGLERPEQPKINPALAARLSTGKNLWGVVPRPRPNVMGEAYLPILHMPLGKGQGPPALLAGRLSVFGPGNHSNGETSSLGFVGQPPDARAGVVPRSRSEAPTKPATLMMVAQGPQIPKELSGYQPFGKSYALYNFNAAIQVGAILTLTRASGVAQLEALGLLAESSKRA